MAEMDNTYNFTGLVQRGDKAINERYRPRTFHEVIGNMETKRSLAGWMERGSKRSASILLTGGSGQGKTTIARILAMGLNCEKGDTVNPCCECPSCKAAMAGEAMHIKEYNMSALSTKDDADAIVNSLYDSSFTGRNTVAILDEIQGMSVGSQNLMLKMLENPPKNTYIILATTDPQKIIKTIKTRCETYEFREPSTDNIKQMLGSVVKQELPSMPIEQRNQILEACRGLGYREILMKLEKFIKGGGTGSVDEAFQPEFASLAKSIMRGDLKGCMAEMDKYDDTVDANSAKRVIRVFACNQIKYSYEKGDVAGMKRSLAVFRIFDDGFYADPKPIPSLKADVIEACMIMAGM